MKPEPISTAPKRKRILAWGRHGGCNPPMWATVKWCSTYGEWWSDPTDATEDDPCAWDLTHWLPLPLPPDMEA